MALRRYAEADGLLSEALIVLRAHGGSSRTARSAAAELARAENSVRR